MRPTATATAADQTAQDSARRRSVVRSLVAVVGRSLAAAPPPQPCQSVVATKRTNEGTNGN